MKRRKLLSLVIPAGITIGSLSLFSLFKSNHMRSVEVAIPQRGVKIDPFTPKRVG